MLVAVFLGVVVIYLAMKAPDPNAPTSGEPNGTSTSGMGLGTGPTGPDNSLPYLGANGTPTPLTGSGLPGGWAQNLQLLSAVSPFAAQRWNGNGASGGESYFPAVRSNTGVLDPLASGGATKRLQTQGIQPLPGYRGLTTQPTGKL